MSVRPDREVTFVTRVLTHYRVPFHELVRAKLASQGVTYRLIVGQPDPEEAAKGDLATLDWAETVTNRPLFGQSKLVWQPVLGKLATSDLVIVGQENGLLANYVLQSRRKPDRKIALFGHGRNFQSRNPGGAAERWKRFWATKCDWWFAYTDETRRHVEALGFPPERITVFNNATDTAGLRETVADLSDAEIAGALGALGMHGGNVGIFVGGLYPDKRLEFLVAAADIVRSRVSDFELLVVGSGSDRSLLDALASTRPWLFVAGPRFGREKAALMCAAKLFLMPGLVGLAVLDAASAKLPVVTTAFPWHSPEIAYLEHGENGVIVPAWQDAGGYAQAVIDLLQDNARRTRLAAAANALSSKYTIETMAERFAAGVLAALD